MKALEIVGPRQVRVVNRETPTPKRGWIRIKVERVGICGTDKAFYKGTYKLFKKPLIPGHEIAGIVDSVGDPSLEDLIGHRITTEINVYCGKCLFCKRGMKTHCPYRETIGISIDGGMAEYVLTRSDLVHVIDDLDPATGALIEPLAAVVEINEMYPIRKNSSVAVIGGGTIGLLSLAYVRSLQPSKLIAVLKPDSPKKKWAIMYGADRVVSTEEIYEYISSETPEGQGFDYVIEATGNPAGLDLALDIVRPRGIIAAKSTHGSPVSFDITKMIVKEVILAGSRCGPFGKAIDLIRRKKIDPSPLVTGVFSLDDGERAFEESFNRDHIKVQLEP